MTAGAPPSGEPHSPTTIARNALLRGIGEITAKLGSVVFFVLVARELGERGFGDFMFALSLTSVLCSATGSARNSSPPGRSRVTGAACSPT